ncbi:MAG: T9SS type A sorting domain-containing protein [Prolixibacteraceae bacterium]|nr:T9SS type A sorting domain-containing protein [Prolixibacteraceae bacterium]
MKNQFIKPEYHNSGFKKTFASLLFFASILFSSLTASSVTPSTTYWDILAMLDFGGTFPVTGDATLITSGSVFTILLNTKEIANTPEEHSITFEGTHDNGVYTISNFTFNPFDDVQATINNATFTVNGNNLTGEGSFSETIPEVGEINGTFTATGTKVGEDPFLTVNPQTLALPSAGGSQASFNVASNVDWTVSNYSRWLSVSPSAGTNNGSVTVTAAANGFLTERSSIIFIRGTGVTSQMVNVTQAANGELTFKYPAPRYGHTASKICKFVYLFGGRNYQSTLKSASLNNNHNTYLSNALYRYDTISQVIYKLDPDIEPGSDPLPGMMGHNAYVYIDEMYVMNGTRSDTNNTSTYFYDPITYSWEQDFIPLPYLPKSHAFLGMKNVTSDSVFVAGGQKRDSLATDSCHWFNQMTGEWATMPTMPLPALHSGASIFTGNKFYTVGGMANDVPSNLIKYYEPVTETWTAEETSLPAEMYGMSFASIKNILYIYGGAGSSNLKSSNAYKPEQFSTTLFQVSIDTISGEIIINERANTLPPLLYSAGWTEERDGDTLFYTFGGINAIFPDGDTLLTNNFYRFNITDSLVQQYDTLLQTWGNLRPEVFTSADTLNFETAQSIAEPLYVASNTTWKISASQPWLSTDIETVSGNQLVMIYAGENTSLEEREATLQISCNDEPMKDIVVIQAGAIPFLSASTATIGLTAESNSAVNLDITSNTQWTAESDQAWLTVDPLSGTGNGSIQLTAKENNNLNERIAVLTISAVGIEPLSVIVTQTGANPYLSVSASTLNVSAEESPEVSFDISSNTSWNLSIDQTWVTSNVNSGTGNATVHLSVEENTKVQERVATVNVSATGTTLQTITIIQAAAPATLSVSVTTIDVGAEEGSEATFDVTSNTTWSVSSGQPWLAVNPESGTGIGTVTLSAEANSTGSVRQANITISAEGVTPQTVEVSQNPLTGIDEYLNGIHIYPNPFSDRIFVNNTKQETPLRFLEQNKACFSLYNLNGQLIFTREIQAHEYINTRTLAEGIYFVELKIQNKTFRIKMIKQKE